MNIWRVFWRHSRRSVHCQANTVSDAAHSAKTADERKLSPLMDVIMLHTKACCVSVCIRHKLLYHRHLYLLVGCCPNAVTHDCFFNFQFRC